ncbi:MAG: hypothetical protein IE926_01495 [Micrococcales bacterium]|nr:hypothetical protein [Micrococcales bacterium]
MFGGPERDNPKPARPDDLEVLITVKAAPNPSAKSGETVCVAGLGLSEGRTQARWIRLYPINFRFLEQDQQFKKYDIIRVRGIPAAGDSRVESWQPDMATMKVIDHLDPWRRRRALLEPTASDTMCELNRQNQHATVAPSLGLVPVRSLTDLRITDHAGWTPDEQAKIDAYVNQFDLFDDSDKSPLEAPRFEGHYRWKCYDAQCNGHDQSIIDWEFVALQRRLRNLPAERVRAALREKFVDMMFRPPRQPAFFVGNQAKRHHVFHVLGVYYPN